MMEMGLPTPHALKNAAKIHVGECEDAGTLWISSRKTGMRCSTGMMVEKSEVLLKNASPWERNIVNPRPGEMVGVRDPQTNKWHRGRVMDIDTTGKFLLYELFLIDYGMTLKVPNHDLCVLSIDFKQIPPIALKLKLFGVLPCQIDPNSSTFTVASDWSPEANAFVRHLLENVCGGYVVPKAADAMSYTLYGELYFLRGKKIISLSEELVVKGFAKRDEHTFIERHNLALGEERAEASSSKTVESVKDVLACRLNAETQKKEKEERKNAQSIDESVVKAGGRKTFKSPVRTFYPAGFCMDEADKMLQKRRNEEENRPSRESSCNVDRKARRDEALHDVGLKHDLGENPYFPRRAPKNRQPLEEKRNNNQDENLSLSARELSRVSHNERRNNDQHNVSFTRSSTECKDKGQVSQLPLQDVQPSTSYVKEGQPLSERTANFQAENVPATQNYKPSGISARAALLLKCMEDMESILRPTACVPTSKTEKACFSKEVNKTKVNDNNYEEAVSSQFDIKKADDTGHENDFENNSVKHEDNRMRSLQPPSEDSTSFPEFEWCGEVEDMSNSFIRKQSKILCLLHGAQRPEGNGQCNLVRSVTEALQQRNQPIPRVHELLWAFVLQKRNILTVNPRHRGQRFSCIPPLLHFLVAESNENEIPKGNGPVLLILTSGSNGVEEIGDICRSLLKANKDLKITVINSGDGKSAMALQVELVNGCHILISTPLSFVRSLNYGEMIINFNRLRYLVLDEANILVHRFLEEVKFILLKLTEALKKKRAVDQFQIVVSAEKWVFGFSELVEKIPSPVIFISSFMEAAAYANLKPRIHLPNSSQKLSTLIDLLKNRGCHRTVIVCSKEEEVSTIVGACSRNELEYILVATTSMTVSSVHGVTIKWYSSANKYPILVCCDDLFQELKIEDASHLIHYSLPPHKRIFDIRFSCLLQNLPNILEKKTTMTEKKLHPVVDIFINETDKIQLPLLVPFLKKLKVDVHPDLETRAELAIVEREQAKSVVPLCGNIISFGNCWNKLTCTYRHIIINKDKPPIVPRLSTVKLKIFSTQSVCQFGGRILEFIDQEGNRIPIHNRHMEVTAKLQNYFKDDNKKRLVASPEVYDICALQAGGNIFKRAQIVADAELDRSGQPVKVFVCDIDDWNVHCVKVSQLYELPDELKNIPRQSVEIVLCNLCPIDKDWGWSYAASLLVSQMVGEVELEGRYWRGRVKASLANCVWIEPLDCCQIFPILKTSYEVFSLRSRIIKEGLAMDNPSHLKSLFELFKKSGMSIVDEEEKQPGRVSKLGPKPQPEEKFNPQWAFLSSDEFHYVSFVTGDDPGRFFLRHAKFEVLLENLSKKISKFVQDKQAEQTLDNAFSPEDYCIAKFDDGKWYRAYVRSIENDTLDLYFVDFGDVAFVNKSEVFHAPPEIFTQLPFQAIECELACIGPSGVSWCNKAYDILFDQVDDPDCEGLYAKVLRKQKADCTGGCKYSVILIAVKGAEKCILNQLLVNEGVAHQTEEERKFLETIDHSEIVTQQKEIPDRDSEDEGTECNFEPKSESFEPRQEKPSEVEEVSMIDFDNVDIDDCMEFFNSWRNEMQPKNTLTWKETSGNEKNEEKGCATIGDNSTSSDFSQGTDDCSESSDYTLMPRLVPTIKHPLVIWRQDYYNIWLEIDICGVKDYFLQAEPFKLTFCTEVNDELCGFIIHLWGAVNPDKVIRKAGGLRFLVKLYKLLVGVNWDHLVQQDKKVPWVKYDVNSVAPGKVGDEEDEKKIVEEAVEKAREQAPEAPKFVNADLEIGSDYEEEEEEEMPGDPFLVDPDDPLM